MIQQIDVNNVLSQTWSQPLGKKSPKLIKYRFKCENLKTHNFFDHWNVGTWQAPSWKNAITWPTEIKLS
jgi:hypothetical protein